MMEQIMTKKGLKKKPQRHMIDPYMAVKEATSSDGRWSKIIFGCFLGKKKDTMYNFLLGNEKRNKPTQTYR